MPTIVAEPVADVDKTFEDAVAKIREWAIRRHGEVANGSAASRWLRLSSDDGKVFDRDALGKGTDRKSLNDKLIRAQTGTPATAEADAKIGAVGDQVALTLQIDFLALLERARRQTTMTPVRARILAASRRLGHSNPRGVFAKNWRGFVADVVKRTKTGA